MQYIDDSLPS